MEKQALPLPPGWRELHSDKGVYFWHKETNRVQWKFPKSEALSYQKVIDSHSYVNVQRSQPCNNLYNGSAQIKPQERETPSKEINKGCSSSVVDPVCFSSSPPPPLPTRNYDEQDVLGYCHFDDEENTPPPPVPEKTYLSDQLISPSKMREYLYSSNVSDLSSFSLGIKEDEYSKKSQEKTEAIPSGPGNYDEIAIHESKKNKTEFMIAANPPVEDILKSTSLRSSETSVNTDIVYDEIHTHLSSIHDLKPDLPVSDDLFKVCELPNSSVKDQLNSAYSPLLSVSNSPDHSPLPPNYLTPSPLSPSKSTDHPPLPSNNPSNSHDRPSLPPNHPSKSPDYPFLPPNHPSKSSDHPPLPANHPSNPPDRPPLPPNHPSRSPDYPLFSPNHPSNPTDRPPLPPNHPSRSPDHPPLPPNHPSRTHTCRSTDHQIAPTSNISCLPNSNTTSTDHQSFDSPATSDNSSLSQEDNAYSLVASKHPMLSDNGLMTVIKQKGNSSTLPSQHRYNFGTPQLPPRRGGSVRTKTSPDLAELRKVAASSDGDSLSDGEYDRLIHDKFRPRGATCTLPNRIDDPAYSKISNDAILMRSGVTIKGSLMTASNSSLPHDSDDDQTTLVHVPNAPSTKRKPRPHTYEDMDEEKTGLEDPPSPVWDHSDFSTNVLKPKSKPVKVLNKSKISIPLIKPNSVTNEDFQRRLERLDNHYYPEIDIPLWPGEKQEPVLSPRRASEIKKVVRNSWNVTCAANGLPAGWKREVNEQGQVFYWHLPTGNIQYTKPEGSFSSSSKSQSPADSDDLLSPKYLKPTTFAAEYMGSLEVSEDKLIKGRSVQVVFNAIDTLIAGSPSPHNKLELVSHFKPGDRVHLQVHEMDLKWLNATDGTVALTQAINRIRVWGVGKDNNKDFGYVSRNIQTQRHQCHVFRCDIAAAGLIHSLLNNHDANRKRTQSNDGLSVSDIGNDQHQGSVLVSVPLASAQRQRSISEIQKDNEKKETEKYKRLEAVYLGSKYVTAPHGIAVVNRSIAHLSLDKSKWIPVYLDVAPSHIIILDKKTEIVLKEHRIRFLSFLGIAQDDRYCGYVVDNGDNQFQFHGFYSDPNCDRLCLALHSACQSRYQRVVDAHITDDDTSDATGIPRKKSLLKRIGSWKASKPTSDQEEETIQSTSRNFIVQFLGVEAVTKPKGVDVVTEPLQKATKKTSGIHLVELIISGTGFTINDPQKKQFASKHISSKKITYCVRIRSHFIFIAKEGSKFMLYMFSESEVDAASLVNAVQELMS